MGRTRTADASSSIVILGAADSFSCSHRSFRSSLVSSGVGVKASSVGAQFKVSKLMSSFDIVSSLLVAAEVKLVGTCSLESSSETASSF